jgi:hypothetical protein
MIKLAQAIQSLKPNSDWIIVGNGYSGLNWKDTQYTKPTEAEVNAEVARLQAEYESNEYQRLRQYPSLGDQLDMLWHAIDNGTLNKTSDFYTAIKAVKDAHPKE